MLYGYNGTRFNPVFCLSICITFKNFAKIFFSFHAHITSPVYSDTKSGLVSLDMSLKAWYAVQSWMAFMIALSECEKDAENGLKPLEMEMQTCYFVALHFK